MKYKTTQARGLAAALTLFGSFIGGANAALLINWQQDGANVVATTSGSIEAPLTYSFNDSSFYQDSYLYSQGAYIGVGGSSDKDSWEGSYTGSFSAAFSMSDLDSGFYVGVGIAVNGGIVDSSYIYGSSINSSSTWTSTDLLTLGLSVDDNQIFTYNTASGTDTITFQVTPVPEPSSAMLLALGGLGLASRRSRR